MLNKLLKEQLQKYVGKIEVVPPQYEALLQVISDTYDGLEKEYGLEEKPKFENQRVIKELISEAEELRKAHSQLGRILNSVNYGFFSRDIFIDNYTYLSVACERIYGYTAQEFFENSRLWYDVILPEDRWVVERDNEQLGNKEEVYTQYRIVHKDKSIRWIELTLIPSFKDEKLSRVDGVVCDITKRKEAETEREAMLKEIIKSNADLKQFSYITSHNLRAPLSNISGILSLFDIDENDTHNRQMLEMLKASAQQLNATIDDLTQMLIVKNNSSPDLTYLSLEDSFNETMSAFNSALDDIGATVFTDFVSPVVLLNKVYLNSIFTNLISNAIKYCSPERPLTITVESREDESGYVKIRFSDNGIGIDLRRHKDKVFGLYQRFNDGIVGQGVGLFITKSQIEATGGKIVVESEPGVGTTFIITLRR